MKITITLWRMVRYTSLTLWAIDRMLLWSLALVLSMLVAVVAHG